MISNDQLSQKTIEDQRRSYEGFVYVIAFASGTIKVGKTQRPKTRLTSHRSTARMTSTHIESAWFSPRHRQWNENEDRLISFCLKRFGPPVFGRETFRGEAPEVVEYAKTLPCSGMSLDEIATHVNEQNGFAAKFAGSRVDWQIHSLMRQAEIYLKLTNDENRPDANEQLYNVMLEVADRIPAAWAFSDPDAALRHAESLSVDPRGVVQRAREFERSGRVLFLLSYGRWPDTFDEVIGYFKVATGEAPAGVLVCRQCNSDWGVQEFDDDSCLNCGFGTASRPGIPAGVIYEAPKYAGSSGGVS